MKKNYAIKFLPVEGSDKFQPFLCTPEFEVGDMVYGRNPRHNESGIVAEKGKSGFWLESDGDDRRIPKHGWGNWVKKVCPVSDKAIWIVDGDEFEPKDVQLIHALDIEFRGRNYKGTEKKLLWPDWDFRGEEWDDKTWKEYRESNVIEICEAHCHNTGLAYGESYGWTFDIDKAYLDHAKLKCDKCETFH